MATTKAVSTTQSTLIHMPGDASHTQTASSRFRCLLYAVRTTVCLLPLALHHTTLVDCYDWLSKTTGTCIGHWSYGSCCSVVAVFTQQNVRQIPKALNAYPVSLTLCISLTALPYSCTCSTRAYMAAYNTLLLLCGINRVTAMMPCRWRAQAPHRSLWHC